MIKDAESHAEDDRKQRELAEARNVGENAAYQAEKQLEEMGEQLDGRRRRRSTRRSGGPRRARVRRRRGDQVADRRPAGGLPQGLRADVPQAAASSRRPRATGGVGATAPATRTRSSTRRSWMMSGLRRPSRGAAGGSTRAEPASEGRGQRARPARPARRLDALLDDIKRERDEYLDLAQRAKADFENYRKRAAREAADAERRAKVALARELVPSIDNLERALARQRRSRTAHEAARAGCSSSAASWSALGGAGVEAFDPAGERFDPAHSEAISTRRPGTTARAREPWSRRSSAVTAATARAAAGPGNGQASEEPMAGDHYEVLGVVRGRRGGGDQEGVPQARAQVPPRPQPRRPEGRGALQGGPGRL